MRVRRRNDGGVQRIRPWGGGFRRSRAGGRRSRFAYAIFSVRLASFVLEGGFSRLVVERGLRAGKDGIEYSLWGCSRQGRL